MSSIKFDSKANADEVVNMTLQWGYKPAAVSQKPEPIVSDNETLNTVFRMLNPVINFFSMLAGAATAIAILAFVAWQVGILQIPA